MWDHAINLKPDFKPSDCKVYLLSPKEQEVMKEFIKENLASGQIRQSKSPMASPFFFIKKEDGSLRAIQDYRKLNEGTVKNKYPLPLINKLIDKVKDVRYITKLDIRWGYYNIQIREGDE
ncbi:reverse transcriptase-RNase H-integrase [Sanghuangporus baumii]|uniref:Reverse transcriptase-RNase H-integrase n=1 Tax=Sanghuangporus baumii TaxID=108892 RepID=A0A9Q5HRG4_SANBA|nr:reverse transcriptase-RNase H-integrase [Sanghuangporus baumii]